MLKTIMGFSLTDIMDLDFLLDLDGAEGDPEKLLARDRDIYQQIEQTTPHLDDKGLILSWLEYRKLLCFHEAGEDYRLPGTLYAALYRWTARAVFFLGLVSGLLTAYSFLAYHGSRPVNVTVFIAFFILLQALLALTAGMVMVRWIQSGGRARAPAFFQPLIFDFFMKKFLRLVNRSGELPGGGFLKSVRESAVLSRFKSRAYNRILFWPFFMITSLAALGFSLGSLGGTLFRVMVTDLAFGWQSTLFTSGSQIYQMVTGLALPWSWLIPDGLPSLAQVEGSRIVLKQGMAGLATEHLTAWWPFLSLGILVYGILPRLVLLAGAARARKKALADFDFDRPRYQRLIMRMQTPRMDTRIRETGGTRAVHRAPLPDPELACDPDPAGDSSPPGQSWGEKRSLPVLASGRGYPDESLADIAQALDRQMGITVSGVTRIDFDFEGDEQALSGLAEARGPVIILQEVWQPPIRGLLYYFTRIRQEIFPDRDLWIFLTRTPGEGPMAVDREDMDFKVWQTAVAQLKDPGIVLERWVG